MHSSRMRTGRSLTVCRSLLLGGGEGLPLAGSASLGGVCHWGGGVCFLGGLPLGGGGVCLFGGGIPACTEVDPPREQNDKQV